MVQRDRCAMQVVWLSKLMWRGAMIELRCNERHYPWYVYVYGSRVKDDAEPRKLLGYLWS